MFESPGVRLRVTVIQEVSDATVREIDTDSSNPARSANYRRQKLSLRQEPLG